MNSISLIIFLSVMITMIHCSIISRTNNRNDVDPLEVIRDNYGCDAVIKSCGNKGKCCDIHDACYKRHGCKAISWIYLCKFHVEFIQSFNIFYLLTRGKLSSV